MPCFKLKNQFGGSKAFGLVLFCTYNAHVPGFHLAKLHWREKEDTFCFRARACVLRWILCNISIRD